MVQRRRFSAEYKREAVAMLDAPDVRVSQIAVELGIGGDGLGTLAARSAAGVNPGVSGPWPTP
jgi:transposase-like protein